MDVTGIWIVFPPWIYAVVISLAGRWGEARWDVQGRTWSELLSRDWGSILVINLVFMSLIPTSLLTAIGVLLPFQGARAGLSLGLLAFLFGSVPSRLLAAQDMGWDKTLWLVLIDLLRIAGSLTIVGLLAAT